MENRVTVSICGTEYTLLADENAAYMEKVGELVDHKMDELMNVAHMGRGDAAVLAAVQLADELLKSQDTADNLRHQLKRYLDEAASVKSENSELRRQLSRLQQGNE